MSNLTNRLQALERSANDQPGERIEVIEVIKRYEDGPDVIETTYLQISNLDREGKPIVTVLLPKNGREIINDQSRPVTTEMDEASPVND